jgi:rhodanese-related sulfurtransferase
VVQAELVILGLGVRPNIQLAQEAGLTIGASGGIAANKYQQTSDGDIYAVGDAAEYVFGPTGQPQRVALAGPANRAGRLAGQHAATGRSMPMAPVFGTAIVRVFDRTAAMTGLTAKQAARAGIPARSVTIVANQHAGYFPGATPLTLKLTYDPLSGLVFGAQAVGPDGVDKRIDVIATALALQATVGDLAGLDLAYAPPFGSAKDPIHLAAFAACNQLDGFEEFLDADADLSGKQVVDVRTAAEVEKMPLAGAPQAVNIPVDELRQRLGELEAAAETVVSCGVGLRGHVAARILKQHGFTDVKNLTGGATIRNRIVKTKITEMA